MMFSLAQRGDAPRFFVKANPRGVPVPAIALSTILSLIMVALNFLDTGWLLAFMLNSAGASLLIVWGFISISQLRLRPRLERAYDLPIRMWAYPIWTWVTILALAALALLMLTDATSRLQLVSAGTMFALLFVAALVSLRARGLSPWETAPLPAEIASASA